jgi:hypothetical protein
MDIEEDHTFLCWEKQLFHEEGQVLGSLLG